MNKWTAEVPRRIDSARLGAGEGLVTRLGVEPRTPDLRVPSEGGSPESDRV